MKAASKTCIARCAVLAALLLLPGAAPYAGIVSNANVSPCINTTVLDNHGNNVCIAAGGSLGLSSLVVGTDQTGGVNVAPGPGSATIDGGSSLFVTQPIRVGVDQNGSLSVLGGATVSSAQGIVLGQLPSVTGVALVSGGSI